MLSPLKNNSGRRQTAQIRYVPPPSHGLNIRDDLADMSPRDAIILDNILASEAGTKTRSGYSEHATGVGSAVLSLMSYSPESGSGKMFAASSVSVFDTSTSGAVGAADLTGLSNGQWQHSMFSTPGGTFLVMCNGADGVRTYNGTAWATSTITGSDSTKFITVTPHQSRLWFIENNSMNVHYLPSQSIAGAANAINLGEVSKLGGYLVGMASWTRDGGSGIDDLAVFVTSKGEVHVYSGSDPTVSGGFVKVGTFKVAEPIGRRCFVNVGSDVGILTSQGLLPLSTVLPLAISGQAKQAATDRISPAFQAAYNAGKTFAGWQVIEYPKERLLIVNVPILETSLQRQFVMYAGEKGTWSRFTGMNANCWTIFGDDLYFGSNDGSVNKYGGDDDNGDPINFTLVQAFNNLGTENTKVFKRIRPQFFGPPGYEPRVGLKLDYDETGVDFVAPRFEAPGAAWDEALWDVAEWATGQSSNGQWQSVVGEGFRAAIIVTGSTEVPVTYNGSKISFEVGDGI